MAGLIYILTAISLAVLTAIGRTSGHEMRSTSEVFRYQAGLLKISFFCSFIPLLVNVILLVVSSPTPSVGELMAQMSFAILLTAILFYWHLALKKYSVEISTDGFTINKIFGKQNCIPFSSVERVNLLEGGKGEHVLSVQSGHEKELIRFSESIEDFDSLTELLKARSKSLGIPFFYRDCYGKWSQ